LVQLLLVIKIELAFLAHNKHAVVGLSPNEIVLHVLEHHVEAVLHVVFSAARHLLDNLGPFVTDGDATLKNQYILLEGERVFLNFRIQKVDPPLPALLPVSVGVQLRVECRGDVAPLARAVQADEPDELLVLLLHPVALRDGRLLVLVELVHALAVVPPGYEARNLHPVVFVQLCGMNLFTDGVVLDGPDEEARLVGRPVLLGGVSFLLHHRLQFSEDLVRLFIAYNAIDTHLVHVGLNRDHVFFFISIALSTIILFRLIEKHIRIGALRNSLLIGRFSERPLCLLRLLAVITLLDR